LNLDNTGIIRLVPQVRPSVGLTWETRVTILQPQVSVQNKAANLGHPDPSTSCEQQVPRLRRCAAPLGMTNQNKSLVPQVRPSFGLTWDRRHCRTSSPG